MRIAKSCLGLFLRRQLEKVSSGRTILFTCSNGKNRACGLYRGRSRRERSPFCSPVPSTKLHPNHRGLWSEVMRRREEDERSRSTNEGGIRSIVPILGRDGPKKVPPGDVFHQSPGEISCTQGKLAGHVGDHVVLSAEGTVLVISPGQDRRTSPPPNSLNDLKVRIR